MSPIQCVEKRRRVRLTLMEASGWRSNQESAAHKEQTSFVDLLFAGRRSSEARLPGTTSNA